VGDVVLVDVAVTVVVETVTLVARDSLELDHERVGDADGRVENVRADLDAEAA
jgi:hypothetical protein